MNLRNTSDDPLHTGVIQGMLLASLGLKGMSVDSFIHRGMAPSDWEDIVKLAERHGLAPLLFFNVWKKDLPSPIPDHIQNRLKILYLRSTVKSMCISRELSRILTRFNDSKVPVIVLKGPHLGELVYQERALRPMSDIDLLVRKGDLRGGCGVLYGLGYEASRHCFIEEETKIHSDLPVFIKKGARPVELHWNIELPTSPFMIDLEGIWERALHVRIAGTDAHVLSNEDLLLHLCIHVSYHHRFAFGLLPIVDISETIARYKERINWIKLQMLSEQWRVNKCVYLTLYIARELLGAEVPGEFLKALEPSDFGTQLIETALQAIFSRPDSSFPMTHNLSQLWGQGSFWGKLRIFLGSTFPSPEVLSTMYPVDPSAKRVYLFYLVRVKDLLVRYGRTVIALLKNDAATMAHMRRTEKGNRLVEWLISR